MDANGGRPREQWTSRSGFMLAAIGGAVGLGNIWRFSYVAGENGGAAFLFVYLACVALIVIPLVVAELTLGRRSPGDAIAAFGTTPRARGWRLVGWAGVIAAALILSFYAVIAGWALKYFIGAATGVLWGAAGIDYGGYFRQFISNRGEPLAWQAATLALAMFVVTGGIRRGIERINRMLIPILALIVVALAGYALTLEGSAAGVAFILSPDWSALRQPGMYAAALGQAFFSIGVGMAFFITYGRYVPATFSLPASAAIIAVGDTLFALIVGLAIFSAVFALGADPAAGPELAFITLPQVFLQMPAGRLVGAVFFFLLSTAAITSMVALLEIPVAALAHRVKMHRRTATAIMGAFIFLIGIPSAMSYGVLGHVHVGSSGILDVVDHAASNYLLPVSGIGTALYVGWRLERKLVLADTGFGGTAMGRIWLWLIRVLVPTAILGILLQSAGTL